MATSETRKLAAIMFTDIVGFSRQMGADEARMLQVLEVHNHLIEQAVAQHQGKVIKTIGDAFLVDFPSVVNAVQCAQSIQAQLRAYNAEKDKAEEVHLRIGIHLGDIVHRDGDIFGEGVNIASRLQGLAEPDTICVSHKVYEEVAKKVELGTVVSLGSPKLKNIAERMGVYAVLSQPPTGVHQRVLVHRLKLRQWRGILQAVAIVVLVVAGVGLSRTRYFSSYPTLPLPDKPSIAVLPFTNMSRDPEQEYFSDGITEDLITDLSKISGLFVISRNSVFTYKGKAVDIAEVSRKLGVRYVVEGSTRKAGDRVRINAQLIDATTDYHLWAERYERPLQDIFAVQDEITQRIVATLKVQLTLREQGVLARGRTTDSLEAYDSYLRGLEYYYRLTKEANSQARQLCEQAIERDPQYAKAHALLGRTYFKEWMYQWSPGPQALDHALALAQQAVALDDALPMAHRLLSYSYLWKKQYAQAIAAGEQALVLDPNDADGYEALAEILSFAGRPEEAIGLVEQALRLNPLQPVSLLWTLGFAYELTGRYEEAIAVHKQILSRRPDHYAVHYRLIVIYSELGREAEARAEAEELLRISPNYSLKVDRQRLPVKDPAVLERTFAALRKAGLE